MASFVVRKCDDVKLQKVLHLDQNTGNKLPPTLPEVQNPPPTLPEVQNPPPTLI